MRATPGGSVTAQCLTDAIDDETYGPWIDVRGCTALTFYVSSTGTTSSGVISFEEAAPEDVSIGGSPVFGAGVGDYTSITTKNASDTSGGKQAAVHLTAGQAYYFVRARVSTVIGGGGSVSVSLQAC